MLPECIPQTGQVLPNYPDRRLRRIRIIKRLEELDGRLEDRLEELDERLEEERDEWLEEERLLGILSVPFLFR